MEIIAYIFATIASALQAQSDIDTHFGIPINPEAVTRHWVDYQQAVVNGDTIYYIAYDPSISFMGEPDTLVLPAPDFE